MLGIALCEMTSRIADYNIRVGRVVKTRNEDCHTQTILDFSASFELPPVPSCKFPATRFEPANRSSLLMYVDFVIVVSRYLIPLSLDTYSVVVILLSYH